MIPFPVMKTTLNTDDSVMQRLREESARLLPSWNGGEELVDSANREELYRVMEDY